MVALVGGTSKGKPTMTLDTGPMMAISDEWWWWCWRLSSVATLHIHGIAGTSTTSGNGGRARGLLVLCRCAARWSGIWLRR